MNQDQLDKLTPRELLRLFNKLHLIEELYTDLGPAFAEDAARVHNTSYDAMRYFVVQHLRYTGKWYTSVNDEVWVKCFQAADGFGPWDDELAEYLKGGWDWSHIRDSSEAGFGRIANQLVSLYR